MRNYDPYSIHLLVTQNPDNNEIEVVPYDHAKDAQKQAAKTGDVLSIEKLDRSELERAAPYLYHAAKAVLAYIKTLQNLSVEVADLEFELKSACTKAEQQSNLKVILKQTVERKTPL